MTSRQYYDKYVREEGEGICPTCGKETNFNSFTEGYHKFCSISCLNKSDYIKEKSREASMRKWGVPHQLQSKEFKQQLMDKNMEEFGYAWKIGTPEMREKITDSVQEKYGVDNVFADETIKQKVRKTQEEKYGGIGLSSPIIKEKVKETNLRRYGVENVFASEEVVEVGDFIGEFTNVEKNTRKIIPPYELDLFIQDKKLAIEITGIYWHSTNSGKPKERHLKKTLACDKLGIRLIHINEFEWKNKREICKSILLSALGIYETIINVNDCDIKEVSLSESSVFLDKNHIQGSISSSYQLGVYYKNELVQLATFNKNDEYAELLRVCTKLNTFVIGGFDKVMKTQPFPVVHYFVDKSKFTCSEYTEHGWKVVGETMPSYVYYKGSECIDKQCEQNLMQLLGDKFNSNETPEQNLVRNGYLQVYDCGSIEVIYRKEAINDNKEK